jgi:hypothetical protein
MNWIYKTNKDNSARFVLGTQGLNPLICIGVNPSTAAPEQLDNTLKSVQRQANQKGFDSWIMLNLYAQRATNPKNIHLLADVKLHKANLKTIENIIGSLETATIWAAWGNLIDSRSFLSNCLLDIINFTEGNNIKWIKLGKCSKAGHPHHPLYLPSSAAIEPFDIKNYSQNLKK